MKVFILVTCLREHLSPYSLLVFKTLRTGFPTAEIVVQANGVESATYLGDALKEAAASVNATIELIELVTHHEWVEKLVLSETDPFWICDTDVIFYRSVEWDMDCLMAGALVPEFNDEFTKAITRARLHTSLMYLQPEDLRAALNNYVERHPPTSYNPIANLVHPLVTPLHGRSYFYDTMSMAYHAVGGHAFSPQQRDAYFHFHFGTFSHMVLPALTGGDAMAVERQRILINPSMGFGLWRAQDEYFASRQFAENGQSVIAPIKQKDAEEAAKWNVELCQGNQDAMLFCDLWYRYCHGIDDLIDTLRDGRPRMSKQEMVSLFFNAAVLYGSAFFKSNANLLFPIVLQVTNTYMDSIAWEHSPAKHLRAMADVFRTCGNEMYVMVALICGGEGHMRRMSMAIKERDWLGQHDADGNPE